MKKLLIVCLAVLLLLCGCGKEMLYFNPVRVTLSVGESLVLPETVIAVKENGQSQTVAVSWTEIAPELSQPGNYTVSGTAEGQSVICQITVTPENYLENPGFEAKELAPWSVIGETGGYLADASLAHSGAGLVRAAGSPVNFTLQQNLTQLPEGAYRLSCAALGEIKEEYAQVCLYAVADGVRYEQSFTLNTEEDWRTLTLDGIVCSKGEMTVGIFVDAPTGWVNLDDVLCEKVAQ